MASLSVKKAFNEIRFIKKEWKKINVIKAISNSYIRAYVVYFISRIFVEKQNLKKKLLWRIELKTNK